MTDYKAGWDYFKLDILEALDRFDREEDGLPSSTVRIITGTLEGLLLKIEQMDNCTDAEIKVMLETYTDREKEKIDGSYH
jgi:hypothetical protein